MCAPLRISDFRKTATRYTYDFADGRTIDTGYDLPGNLIRISDSVSGPALYSYDSLNRLIAETTNSGIVSYQYDALSRLIERRINGSDPTIYSYDPANRLQTITYRGKSATYTYDAAGRLTSRILPNGISQSYSWSNANELLAITYRKTDGTLIEQTSYTYDANGNRLTSNRSRVGSLADSAFTATYIGA